MNALITALLLTLPIVPLLFLFMTRGFLRRLVLFPKMLFFSVGLLVLYVVIAVFVATAFTLAPWLLLFLVPIALYVYVWRARDTYGAAKRLPPGSLRIAPIAPWLDVEFYQKESSRCGPVFKTSHIVHPMVCINTIALGLRFLKDHEDATTTPPMPFNQYIPRGFMRYMPANSYNNYRRGLGVVLSSGKLLVERDAQATAIVRRCLDELTQDARPLNPAHALQWMTFEILSLLFFGVSSSDECYPRLASSFARIDYRRALTTRRTTTERHLDELERIIWDSVGAAPSYVREMCRSERLRQSIKSRDKSFLRNVVFMMLTATIDVSDLLLWVWRKLSEHPDWATRLREQASNSATDNTDLEPSLATRIVMETLRLEQSEYLMRKALVDIRFEDYLIPKNWLIRIGIREGHRDATVFDHPEVFDPDRFLCNVRRADGYSPFGMLTKSCIGTRITMWIGEKFANELATGYCWTTVTDAPRELGAFHWRPGSAWTLRIESGASPAFRCVGPRR